MKDDLPKDYDFIKEEEERIDRYTAKMLRIWGTVGLILVLISVGIEVFWPLPK